MSEFGPTSFLIVKSFKIKNKVEVELNFKVRCSFFSLSLVTNYNKLQDDAIIKQECFCVLVDFIAQIENKFLLKYWGLGGGEVIYFLSKCLVEHHNRRNRIEIYLILSNRLKVLELIKSISWFPSLIVFVLKIISCK